MVKDEALQAQKFEHGLGPKISDRYVPLVLQCYSEIMERALLLSGCDRYLED